MQFITRKDTILLENGSLPFKFVSFNIPNLHFIEDPVWHRATSWEQTDALDAITQIGGRVIRIYPLSFQKSDKDSTLKHFLIQNGTWILNSELFQDLDSALALARDRQIRVILPFIDYWDFWGGIPSFQSALGLPPDSQSFFQNDISRNAFKNVVSLVLNRVNSVSGIIYKNDPTILAWETGNELSMNGNRVPLEWTLDMARHIKSIDPNHLLMDGSYGKYGWDSQVLSSPLIDIYSNHYYIESLDAGEICLLVFLGCILISSIGLLFGIFRYPYRIFRYFSIDSLYPRQSVRILRFCDCL